MTAPPTEIDEKPASPRSRRRRPVVIASIVAIVAAIAGGALWVYSVNATANADAASTDSFVGATEEIVAGDLQGETVVTGTLRFSRARAIQAGTEGTVTALPEPGSVLTRGERLYSIDDVPSFLLTGALPAWRDFTSGMSDGPDVRQLEENLRDLGYFTNEPDDRFGWATAEAIKRWQEATGQRKTGALPLGSVVFSSGDVRVGEIGDGVGAHVSTGADLYNATDTTQVVEAAVALADQQLATRETPVTVRLPGGENTTGRIVSVGTPTEIDGASGQKQTVIPIVVSLDDPTRAAAFQQASVSVSIPNESREGVLSVPVGALLALTAQQFGVEIVDPDGTTRKVPVTTGLFAGGRVEIDGDGVEAGQRVVVPKR